MKMTDDLADQLRNKLRNIISGYRINEDDAGWLEGVIAARLAADQQKGGGEVKCSGYCCPACGRCYECHRHALDCLADKRTTPKPSIPAPAQQEVGDVEAVEFRAAFFVSKDGNRVEQLTSYEDYRSDGAILRLMDLGQKRASAKKLTKKGGGKVVLSWIGAALAHPPHADQETQS